MSDSVSHTFRDHHGLYVMEIPDLGVRLTLDQTRREFGALVGELTVRAFDAVLSVGDFRVSDVRARDERAKLLERRSRSSTRFGWPDILEDFCQRVLIADRTGDAPVSLRDVQRGAGAEQVYEIDGVRLPRQHPGILFAMGGAGKSYFGLFLAVSLAQRGVRVALFDWELGAEDHRDRLERLCGADMPEITYVRCDRALVFETERLRRIVADRGIQYAVFDSVAFACHGAPESAEAAGAYFRATRQIGIGSLHIAHVTKSVEGEQKPFGSIFWWNGARAAWEIKPTEDNPPGEITIGVFQRKANLGPLAPAIGFRIVFEADRTTFTRIDVADVQDLAGKLPVRQRMVRLLRRSPLPVSTIAEELDVSEDTVKKTVKRHPKTFVRVPSVSGGAGLVSLVETRSLAA